MSDQVGYSSYYLLWLVLLLPAMALMVRRLHWSRVGIMALAWIGIFAVGLLITALVSRNDWLTSRVREVFYGRDQSVVGGEVRIPMADDGHFYARATINGYERTLLVDSGATLTSLSAATADAAKIKVDPSAPPYPIDTANGRVSAQPAMVATLKVGAITASGLKVAIAPEFGDMDVLGMNFLSKLKTWRVEGKTLILVPNRE
ncbi:MAG: TIGR02281 family clan AA aspartic protease [Pseudomonadota bacterium]